MCIRRASRSCNLSDRISLCQVQPTQVCRSSLARGHMSMHIFIAKKMRMAISISNNPGFDVCTTTHLNLLYIQHHVPQVTVHFYSVPLALCYRTTAGPGSWPNGTSFVYSSSNDVHASAAYNLIDTYDSSNWASKFDVQDIADPTRMFVGPHSSSRA